MDKKYSFCHGWMVRPRDFNEVTCRRRESCRYYDVEFYKKHAHHLDEFEEMFPMEPCQFFLPNYKSVKKEEGVENNDFFALNDL